MIVCVSANPSVDKLFAVDRLVPGTIHRPDSFVQVAGGKGLNVARAAVALGGDVVAVALLRGHRGRWLADALEREGVPGRFAWTNGENRDSLSVADLETGRLTEFYEEGSPIGEDAWPRLEATYREALDGATWVSMSGSMPPGAPLDGFARLVRLGRAAGVRTALDTWGASLARGIDAGPDVIKINAREASDVLARSVEGPWEAAEAARELRRRAGGGTRVAIVTLGTEGAVMAGPDERIVRGTLHERGPYPVASGDAFLAGLITSLDRETGPRVEGEPSPAPSPDAAVAALRLGLGAAAANAREPGAGRLDAARARELAASAGVDRR